MRTLLQTLSLLLLSFSLSAQFTISGCVTDDNGDALIGASILIKGTTIGTVTDIDGCFSLKAPEESVELIISYTGFNSQEVKVNSQKPNLNITLGEAAVMLDEVVVTGSAPVMVMKESGVLGSRTTSANIPSRRKERKRNKRRRDYTPNIAPKPSMQGHIATAPNSVRRPTNHDPISSGEGYNKIQENNFQSTKLEAVSTLGIDVDAASYSNIRRFFRQGSLPPVDAVRIEEMVNYFDYSYPNPSSEHPFHVKTELAPCPWQPDHLLLQVGLQGKRMATADLPPNNFVFLLDVSGSMDSYNKLPLLKESLSLVVDNMREEDKVSIVVYAGAAGLVLPPTSGSDKQKIKDALEKLSAGGSTAGGAGIQLAYKTAREAFLAEGNNRVILATDGDFNVGVSDQNGLVKLIEKERESGVFLSVLGFGRGNYQDGKMQQLADKGNGNHAYIDDLDEAKKVLVKEFGGTLFTIAKDVKLQLTFNPEKVAGYRLIGYENRLLAKEDFDDDTKDAGEMGAGHNVTALYEIIPAGQEIAGLTEVVDTERPTQVLPSFEEGEWCKLNLRYKKPKAKKSQLLSHLVKNQAYDFGQTSNNFRWSAAVAEFGLLLRASEFKGIANYQHCKEIAEGAKGKDTFGYRQQMIDMIIAADQLSATTAEK